MFKMNDDMIHYLLGQRTNLKDSEDPAKDYYEECLNEYSKIEPFLPKKKNFKMVDIGCGLGGVSVIIQQKHPEAMVYMYDKDGEEDQRYYDKKDTGKYFNSNDLTAQFVLDNVKDIGYAVVINDLNTVNRKVDVITSFLSMGYHYPVAVYGEFIAEKLKKNGLLIIDQRRQVKLKTLKHEATIAGSQKRLHRHVYRNV